MGGTRLRIAATVVALAAPWAVDTAGPVAAAAPSSADRQAAFARASAVTGVPEPVLLAVAFNESWWEQHGGAPSTTGSYGVMGLTDVPAGAVPAKGVDGGSPDSPSLHTLATAARLAGVGAAAARTGDAANILAGAALLASQARALGHGRLPAGVAGWYGAVARYAGTPSAVAAAAFADDVYATLARGAARQTADGQHVVLAAMPGLRPARSPAAAPGQRPAWAAECPADLHCDVVPAAYARNDPRDPGDYGSYDLADRPHGPAIDHIVLHDTEGSYAGAVATFTNPANYVSAHYVIRAADGHVTQMVRTRDVAWHAGNWYLNMHSVGIEQEGYAVRGATWFTERLYRSSARLVRYLAARYRIPLDRQHILGHDNVPGTIPARVARMHWDPGPFWDWNHYLALLGRPVRPSAGPGSPVVTIAPRFTANVRAVTDCEGGATVPRQPASFVYLRTAPSPTAPLVGDPALHPGGAAGTTCAADWATRPAPASSSWWPAGVVTGPRSGGTASEPGSTTGPAASRPPCRAAPAWSGRRPGCIPLPSTAERTRRHPPTPPTSRRRR
jgi:hypothetical protein